MKKLLITAIALALFAGCENPVEEKTVYVERDAETVTIGLNPVGYEFVQVREGSKIVSEYYTKDIGIFDTAYIEVPVVDSVNLATYNNGRWTNNVVPVSSDSVYTLRY